MDQGALTAAYYPAELIAGASITRFARRGGCRRELIAENNKRFKRDWEQHRHPVLALAVMLGWSRTSFEIDDSHHQDGGLNWAALHIGGAELMVVAHPSATVQRAEQALLVSFCNPDLLAHGARPGSIVHSSPGPYQWLRIYDPERYCPMGAQRDDDAPRRWGAGSQARGDNHDGRQRQQLAASARPAPIEQVLAQERGTRLLDDCAEHGIPRHISLLPRRVRAVYRKGLNQFAASG